MVDVEKNGGFEKPAVAGGLAAGHYRGPVDHGILNMAPHDFDLLLGDQRADIDRVRPVIDTLPDRPHPLCEQCDKPVVGRRLDVHPLH